MLVLKIATKTHEYHDRTVILMKIASSYLRQRRREETQTRMTPRFRKTMNWQQK